MISETQITPSISEPGSDGRRWDVVAAVAAAILALGLVVVAGTSAPANGAPSRAVAVEAAP